MNELTPPKIEPKFKVTNYKSLIIDKLLKKMTFDYAEKYSKILDMQILEKLENKDYYSKTLFRVTLKVDDQLFEIKRSQIKKFKKLFNEKYCQK